MPKRRLVPVCCLEPKPTPQTVRLSGIPINLSALARTTALDLSYLSRILSGNRAPTVTYLEQIADALGMDLEPLLVAIRARRARTLRKTA